MGNNFMSISREVLFFPQSEKANFAFRGVMKSDNLQYKVNWAICFLAL